MDPHYRQSSTPWALAKTLWHHKALIWQLAVREVVGRYRGSFMGLAWSFFNPLLMLSIYTLVFTSIFHSRWAGTAATGKTSFAIVLFVGMIVFAIFADNINRAPTLIISNTSYVKRVVFPLEILPVVGMGASLFHALVSMSVWFLAYILMVGVPHLTALFLPLVILPFAVGIVGVSWFLASVGVFMRDVNQTVGILTTALMFLAPVFYSVDNVPASFKPVVMANPATFIIEQARVVLIWGHMPDWFGLAVYSLVSLFIAWAGFWWFQKTRRGFSDVL